MAGSLSLVCASEQDNQTISIQETDNPAFEINETASDETINSAPDSDDYQLNDDYKTQEDEGDKSVNIIDAGQASTLKKDISITESKSAGYTGPIDFDKDKNTLVFPFTHLNRKINNHDTTVIDITCDYAFKPNYDGALKKGISIKRPLTINGHGHTIDAKGKARVFNIMANGVTIRDLTIKNSIGNNPAITFRGSGKLINCKFESNKATSGQGGAVFFQGSAEVINCQFIKNVARYGGAIKFASNAKLTGCTFTGNQANASGGAIYFCADGSQHSVVNCKFDKNMVDEHGIAGAIYFNGKGKVEGCNFTNNNGGLYGGAIYFKINGGEIANCNFIANTVSQKGGALYFYDSGSITNCTFVKNTAKKDGGAICFGNKGRVENCEFDKNTANRGSAIFSAKGCSIAKDCIFKTSEDTAFQTELQGSASKLSDENTNETVNYVPLSLKFGKWINQLVITMLSSRENSNDPTNKQQNNTNNDKLTMTS